MGKMAATANDQRKEFLDTASEGFEFTRRIIEQNLEEVESGIYETIHQSSGWYSIEMDGNRINAMARTRGSGKNEYSWEVPA
jgi:hypothetical protein